MATLKKLFFFIMPYRDKQRMPVRSLFVPYGLGIASEAIIDRQLPFEYTITSRSTDVVVMAQPVQNINHSAFRSMFEREKLSGNNFNDWFRQLKLVLRVEKKMFVIEQPLPAALAVDSDAQVLSQWNAIYDAYNEVACLILGIYIPKPKNPKPSAKEHLAKDDTCHHCKEVGHLKRILSCVSVELVEGKKKHVGSASSSVVARYVEFFEKNLITQEVSGRAIDLKEIQDEDTSPSKITSKIPLEAEGIEPPQEDEISDL
ncbi:hypothetical protein Tco_0157099 [Tanacetum coccineum]